MGWCYLLNGLLSPAVIVQYLLRAVVVLITIPFHESAHALASHLLGDDTAVRAGRLSMNPLRHFDRWVPVHAGGRRRLGQARLDQPVQL